MCIRDSYKSIVDLLLREQFVSSCSRECTVYLKERSCPTIEEMVDHAETFVKAHGLYKFANSPSRPFNSGRPNGKPLVRQGQNGNAAESGKSTVQVSSGKKGSPGPLKCYNCEEYGHLSYNCTKPKRPRSRNQTMALLDQQKALVEAMKEGF